MFDGPIQGAEEGTTFLHHAVEMHFMEEVAVGITEILRTKPGQRTQAYGLQRAPCWQYHLKGVVGKRTMAH